MKQGLLARIKNLLGLPPAPAKAEDPEKALDLYLEKVTAQMTAFNLEINRAVGEEMALRRQVGARKEEIASWEKQARTAVARGRDDLARIALERKYAAAGDLAVLKERLSQQQQLLAELRASYRLLEERVAGLKAKRDELILRLRRAEAMEAAGEALESLLFGNGAIGLDRLADKVIDAEARAEVSRMVAANSLEGELTRRQQGAGREDIEAELQRLKTVGGGSK
ncbi:MAG: phage shock protein [Thermoanaerobacter sp.]|jgi:phage shock protein A|nr:phage shock protein [Thermoanaerobacter sp.]